jgi:hypothetical protein
MVVGNTPPIRASLHVVVLVLSNSVQCGLAPAPTGNDWGTFVCGAFPRLLRPPTLVATEAPRLESERVWLSIQCVVRLLDEAR